MPVAKPKAKPKATVTNLNERRGNNVKRKPVDTESSVLIDERIDELIGKPPAHYTVALTKHWYSVARGYTVTSLTRRVHPFLALYCDTWESYQQLQRMAKNCKDPHDKISAQKLMAATRKELGGHLKALETSMSKRF